MAQDITLLGATYNDVPAVELPKSDGGGVATFTDTSDATLSDPAMLYQGNTAYANGELITGTMPDASVSVGMLAPNLGTITEVRNGFIIVHGENLGVPIKVDTAGYMSKNKSGKSSVNLTVYLPTVNAETYTPTTSDQTIASGQYLRGVQTIKGDANLIPANIKAGVSIFGVQGSSAIAQATVTGTTLYLTDGFPIS